MRNTSAYLAQFDPSGVNNFVNGNEDLKKISDDCSRGYDLKGIFSALLYKGKNIPYLYQKDGITMLHYFAYYGLPNFLQETIKQYRDTNAKNNIIRNIGNDTLYNVFQTDIVDRTALHYACSAPSDHIFVPSDRDGDETKYVADQVGTIKVLLNEGFDIMQKDFAGNTAFDTLIDNFPTYDAVKVLMEKGALITNEHRYIMSKKLFWEQLSRKRFDESNKETFYELFPSFKNKQSLFSDNQLEAQTEGPTAHEKAIYHKLNDLFAIHQLLDNPHMSAEDKIMLDKVSTCDTECIAECVAKDFDYIKQKFAVQKEESLVQDIYQSIPKNDSHLHLLAGLPDTYESVIERSSDSGVAMDTKPTQPAQATEHRFEMSSDSGIVDAPITKRLSDNMPAEAVQTTQPVIQIDKLSNLSSIQQYSSLSEQSCTQGSSPALSRQEALANARKNAVSADEKCVVM